MKHLIAISYLTLQLDIGCKIWCMNIPDPAYYSGAYFEGSNYCYCVNRVPIERITSKPFRLPYKVNKSHSVTRAPVDVPYVLPWEKNED